MALDRDETARLFMASLLSRDGYDVDGDAVKAVQAADALRAALVAVRPEAVAPAPSRPEWVRITGPEDAEGVEVGKAYRVLGWGWAYLNRPLIQRGGALHDWWCAGAEEKPHSTLPSWEPCAAPSPAASPAPTVDRVALARKMRTAWLGETRDTWDDILDHSICGDWLRAADAAIAFMAKGGVA